MSRGAVGWIRPVLNITFALSLLLSVGAIAFFLLGSPKSDWSGIPFAVFGSVAAASIATLGALAVAQTYAERKAAETAQREQEIDQRRWETAQAIRARREESYAVLADHYVTAFSVPGPRPDVGSIRAASALWASQQVLDAMAEWNRLVASLPSMQLGGPAHTQWTVPLERRAEVEEQVGKILTAMRHDLEHQTYFTGGDSPPTSAETIAAMIFNDYDEVVGVRG